MFKTHFFTKNGHKHLVSGCFRMLTQPGNLCELHGQLHLPLASLLPVLTLLVERAVEAMP